MLRPAVRQGRSAGQTIEAFAQAISLDPKWAYDIVKTVGNYGEIFDRSLKPLGWERGDNRLWNDGSLLYSPPFR